MNADVCYLFIDGNQLDKELNTKVVYKKDKSLLISEFIFAKEKRDGFVNFDELVKLLGSDVKVKIFYDQNCETQFEETCNLFKVEKLFNMNDIVKCRIKFKVV